MVEQKTQLIGFAPTEVTIIHVAKKIRLLISREIRIREVKSSVLFLVTAPGYLITLNDSPIAVLQLVLHNV